MADLYQNIVRQPEKEKKAWKVPVLLTAAFLVVLTGRFTATGRII